MAGTLSVEAPGSVFIRTRGLLFCGPRLFGCFLATGNQQNQPYGYRCFKGIPAPPSIQADVTQAKSAERFFMSKVLSLLLVFALLSGCSSYDLGKKVTRLERSIADLRTLQSEQGDALNSLDSQIKLLAGRLEELEFAQSRKIGTDITALRDDLSELRKRIPPPAGVPTAELEADEVWANRLNEEVRKLFIDSLGMIREGKFGDAVSLLENAAEQTEGSEYAGPVLFWLGVTFDGLLDNKGALRSYAASISQYPNSHRAPASLLRQADVFVRLGDKRTAQLSLRKLIDDYPKAPEVVEAKERLRQVR